MKSTLQAVMAGSLLFVPIFAFAQQAGGELQRAQVRNELISLEQAGYVPGYPASLTAAQARLSQVRRGKTAGGRVPDVITAQSVFFGL